MVAPICSGPLLGPEMPPVCTGLSADRSATSAPAPPPLAWIVFGDELAPDVPVAAGLAVELSAGAALDPLGLGLVADGLADVGLAVGLGLSNAELAFGRVITITTIARMATISSA